MSKQTHSVYYPFAGRRFVLVWWTEWKQHHVILAESKAALKVTFRQIIRREDALGVRLVDAFEIELVTPPAAFCQAAADRLRKEEVERFSNYVLASMAKVLKAGHSLPRPFAACTTYKAQDGFDQYSTEDVAEHSGCKNCEYGVRLEMAADVLYDKYAARWESVHRQRRTSSQIKAEAKRTRPKRSKARQAAEGEDLWAAVPDFGHHEAGVQLCKLESDENYLLRTTALFYYKLIGTVDQTWFARVLSAAQRTAEKKQAAGFRRVQARREKAAVKDVAKTLSVFDPRRRG